MESQTVSQTEASEETLLDIVRKLPPERVAQVIDFARFLGEWTVKGDESGLLGDGETEEDIAAEHARWDVLLASDESQRLLRTWRMRCWQRFRPGVLDR